MVHIVHPIIFSYVIFIAITQHLFTIGDIELSIEIITVHLKVLEVRDGATARTIGQEEMGGVQIVSISEIVCPDAPGPSGYTQ